MAGIIFPMKTTIDSVGRIVVPKPLRDALGLIPGSTVDISRYGAGLQLLPTGRTARLVEEAGALIATGDTAIDDDVVFGLIDSGRR
jgi:AbrB family looped-hinge helix DNA binding protein